VVELQELASSLGISERVDFLGRVHDVPSLLSEIDICVQSSVRPEPLGQNVLQYLAAGRPTIATNAGGPAEWITDGLNGLLFELGNEDSLVDALARLTSDIDLRSRLASAAPETPGLVTDAEIARLHGDFFAKVSQSTMETR
jgi:glycosyltransferase involved in cell wall biosynthesis